MMFDPEHQNMDCPKCLRKKVYFDREIGYYCMVCGHELSFQEALLLMEKMVPVLEPAHYPVRSAQAPIVEIKDDRTHRSATEHMAQSRDTREQMKAE